MRCHHSMCLRRWEQDARLDMAACRGSIRRGDRVADCRGQSGRAARGTDGRAAVAARCGSAEGLQSRRVLRAPAATANPRATSRDAIRNWTSRHRCWILPVDRDRRALMATRFLGGSKGGMNGGGGISGSNESCGVIVGHSVAMDLDERIWRG